jgi:hypothetical protein
MQSDLSGQPGPSTLSGQRHTQLPAALAAYNDGRDYAKANLLEIPKINLPKGGGARKSFLSGTGLFIKSMVVTDLIQLFLFIKSMLLYGTG